VQSSGKKEVGVANVLVAIFSEKQSHAVQLLNRQQVTRLDVVNYVSHGMSKAEAASASVRESGAESADDAGVAASPHREHVTDRDLAVRNPQLSVVGRRLELARLLGPVLIAIAIAGWVNTEVPVSTAGHEIGAEVYWSGVLIFVAGLAIVRAHNIWSLRWHVLITLVGWFAIIAGLGRMIAPAWSQETARSVPASWGALLALLVIGIILTWKAYGRSASRSG
jgi:hypothetical protein